ncbi:hypothetical protein K8R43_00700 [archaeon]|nr:hypothetical protein [archaeon]
MKLDQAEKNVMEEPQIKKRLDEGYYLSSLLLLMSQFNDEREWQFVFFHPKTKNVFTAKNTENMVEISPESKPLLENHYEKLSLKGINQNQALTTIQEQAKKIDQSQITKIILTLREGVWRAAITASDMRLLRIDVNDSTGKVEKTETTSLIR